MRTLFRLAITRNDSLFPLASCHLAKKTPPKVLFCLTKPAILEVPDNITDPSDGLLIIEERLMSLPRINIIIAMTCLYLAGCSDKSTFSGKTKPSMSDAKEKSAIKSPEKPKRTGRDLPNRPDDPAKAKTTTKDSSKEPEETIKAPFSLTYKFKTVTDPLADYVFVIDNSVSMGKMIKKVHAGFTAVAGSAKFPEYARVGVLSMTIEESAGNAGKKVGYLKLVDKSQIANSNRSNKIKGNFPGCGPWFTPREKDASGNYCLVSASQFTLPGIGIEAGISSFQRMVKAAQKGLFREGALVNVIFVSDTHEPGKNDPTLTAALTSKGFADLAKTVRENSNISQLKFHAIVPVTGKCSNSNESTHNYSYLPLVDASKGLKRHCDLVDYSSFISDMVVNSIVKESFKIDLPEKFSAVESVTISGDEVNFDLAEDGKSIEVLVPSDSYPNTAEVSIVATK